MSFVLPETVSKAICDDRGIDCAVEFQSTKESTDPEVRVMYQQAHIARTTLSLLHQPEDILLHLPKRFDSSCATVVSRAELIKYFEDLPDDDFFHDAEVLGVHTQPYLNADESVAETRLKIQDRLACEIFCENDISFIKKLRTLSVVP